MRTQELSFQAQGYDNRFKTSVERPGSSGRAASFVRNHTAPDRIAVASWIASGVRSLYWARSFAASSLSTPRRAFLAQVFVDINALPNVLAQTSELQQAPARLTLNARAQAPDQLGNEAQLVGGRERLNRLLRPIVWAGRGIAGLHSPTIPQEARRRRGDLVRRWASALAFEAVLAATDDCQSRLQCFKRVVAEQPQKDFMGVSKTTSYPALRSRRTVVP